MSECVSWVEPQESKTLRWDEDQLTFRIKTLLCFWKLILGRTMESVYTLQSKLLREQAGGAIQEKIDVYQR